MTRWAGARGAGLALLLLLLAACGAPGNADDVRLRVYAAASLTETFTVIAERFEAEHPGTRVQLNFGPSPSLVEQLASGAPADVFASASPKTMDAASSAGDVGEPQDFARNRMRVAVPPDNPAGIDDLADLARRDVKVALCQPQVPCGAVAAEVFDRAGITVRAATEEVDVKSVLTKVRLGEVDAGVVYVTDVLAGGEAVRGVLIPPEVNASTTYPIATVTASAHPDLAAEFVDLVLSPEGAEVLADAGFGRP